jgi:hypothetical protein
MTPFALKTQAASGCGQRRRNSVPYGNEGTHWRETENGEQALNRSSLDRRNSVACESSLKLSHVSGERRTENSHQRQVKHCDDRKQRLKEAGSPKSSKSFKHHFTADVHATSFDETMMSGAVSGRPMVDLENSSGYRTSDNEIEYDRLS